MISHPIVKNKFSEFVGRIAMMEEHLIEPEICFKCIKSILLLEDLN